MAHARMRACAHLHVRHCEQLTIDTHTNIKSIQVERVHSTIDLQRNSGDAMVIHSANKVLMVDCEVCMANHQGMLYHWHLHAVGAHESACRSSEERTA